MRSLDLRRRIYSQLIGLPMSFFAQRRVGELSNRLTTDLTVIQRHRLHGMTICPQIPSADDPHDRGHHRRRLHLPPPHRAQ